MKNSVFEIKIQCYATSKRESRGRFLIAMPERNAAFILERNFSPEQMETLRHGNIPREMEDKWFWYMEGDSDDEELRRINRLLDWWSDSPYDHYGEWISETADAINQSRKDT